MLEEYNSNEELETSENLDEELNLEEEKSTEPETDKSSDDKSEEKSEDLESIKAQLKELEDKNKQLYARIKKSDKPVKRSINSEADLEWRQKIEFITTKGRSLDADDVDEVIAYAKGKGINYEEALESQVIKTYLKAKRHQEKIANAIPQTSSSAVRVNGKTWEEMNEQERAENYIKMLRKK